MNISTMHLAGSGFNCEPVAVDQRETFTDCDLGEITTGPMLERDTAEKPAVVEHDADLGPIVVGRSPDCHGGRRYTGPPVIADLALIVCIAASTACFSLLAFASLAAGR